MYETIMAGFQNDPYPAQLVLVLLLDCIVCDVYEEFPIRMNCSIKSSKTCYFPIKSYINISY